METKTLTMPCGGAGGALNPGGIIIYDPPITTGGGGADGGANGGTGVVTIPTIPPNIDLLLSPEEYSYLNSHPSLKAKYNAFILENGMSEVSQVFGAAAVRAVMKGVEVDFDQIVDALTISPEVPITDVEEYLECFNTSLPGELTIYVNQPTPNSDNSWSITGGVGHAFISISQGQTNRVLGLYPTESASPFNPQDPHAFGNNAGDPYDVSITIPISAFQLSAIISDITNSTLTD